MKSQNDNRNDRNDSPTARPAANPNILIKKLGISEDDEKKAFVHNKVIQAEAMAEVEAKAGMMDDQSLVPDNSN